MRKIAIDPEKCKGCRLCVGVCPNNLLKIAEKPNKKSYQPVFLIKDTCTGCGLCALVCPDIAIEVYKIQENRASHQKLSWGVCDARK